MNRKAQFFIFAAVLVLISLLAIQYSLLSYRQVSRSVSDTPFSDVPFIASYIESSVRETSKNAFDEIYRTGELNTIHESFSEIYSAHYEIEEKELNYYLSRLDVGIETVRTSNIIFDQDLLFVGPSIFEVGNFNRKLLINTNKISDSPKTYLVNSDIANFRISPIIEGSPVSPTNPYVMKVDLNKNGIYENNEILLRESNYTAQSRIVFDGKAYSFGEPRIAYAGIQNQENKAPFINDYYVILGNDGNEYLEIFSSNGNLVSIEGASKFYFGDVFLFNDYLIKITKINYFNNGQKDDFFTYVILNMQISLQETERRREWFDPNDDPGLRYGLVDISVSKENGLKTSQISVGDKVVVSSLVHNDLESWITDTDTNGSKGLGSSIKIWEIVNVILLDEEGVFYSEGSQYKVEVDTVDEKIKGIYEWNGLTWQILDIKSCEREDNGTLDCVSAYPIEEGFQFNLKGEEYVARDITPTSVSFIRRSNDRLDVSIIIDENDLSSEFYKPDYGEFKLEGKTYRAYVLKNVLGDVNQYNAIIDPPLGENIYLKIGEPFILENYALIYEATEFSQEDDSWHIYLRYFDMQPNMGIFPIGKTRLFYGWDSNNFDVVNDWEYTYDDINNKLNISSKNPLYTVETNSTIITKDGICVFVPNYSDTNYYEYDMYYPANESEVWVGEILTHFYVDTFNNYVKIKIDEDKDGLIESDDDFLNVNGDIEINEGEVVYIGGQGFKIISIVPFHEDGNPAITTPDEVGRVLLKKVPYYQYVPILERKGKTNIEEFTTIISVYDYYVRRPGDYLAVFTYSFEIDGIKKETSQYYNFKVYQ